MRGQAPSHSEDEAPGGGDPLNDRRSSIRPSHVGDFHQRSQLAPKTARKGGSRYGRRRARGSGKFFVDHSIGDNISGEDSRRMESHADGKLGEVLDNIGLPEM